MRAACGSLLRMSAWPRCATDRSRSSRLPAARLRPALHAAPCRRNSAIWTRPAGARSDANSARLRARFAGDGIRLGYHNHHWELQPKDGATTALELIFAEAEASPLTWQADVAWLVRGGADPTPGCGATAIAWSPPMSRTSHPPGTMLDEDGWADVGAGVLDWRALWPRAAATCGAQWMVVEHDKPADPGPLRPRELCLSQQARRLSPHGPDDHRHHRLRQSSATPTSRARRARGCVRVKSVADIRAGRGRRARRASMACRAVHDRCAARRSGHRDRRQPDRAGSARAGEPADHRGGQARLSGEAAGIALCRSEPVMQAAAAKGLRVGCAPDTFLGAAHQACRYAIDAGVIGVPVCRRRAPCCRTAWNTGIPTRLSSSSMAADRSSISDPIT